MQKNCRPLPPRLSRSDIWTVICALPLTPKLHRIFEGSTRIGCTHVNLIFRIITQPPSSTEALVSLVWVGTWHWCFVKHAHIILRCSWSYVAWALVQCFPTEHFITKMDGVSVIQCKDHMPLSLPVDAT